MRRIWMAAAILGFANPLVAQERPTGAPVPLADDAPLADAVTHHRIGSGRSTIAYRARWFERLLRDPVSGTPQATISATAYVREDVPVAGRPVMVFFNGGPGASSSPLHANAFGPCIQGPPDPAGKRRFVDNPATLLDIADLVFVDPVGTGFSRPVRAGGGQSYWSPQGDAAAMLTVMRDWLGAEGRSTAPLFVAGESYGGYRLGMMAPAMTDLNIAGLVLISPALDFRPDDDQAAIGRLPTMAVAAWYHRHRRGDPRTPAIVWEAARRFAQRDYALALQQGSALPAAEKARLAARLSTLIDLPAATIAAADLRIDTQAFLETLSPGRIVGRLDTRIVAPRQSAASPNRPAAANDPALGLGRSNVIVSAAMTDYLRDALGVRTRRDYHSLSLDVNFAWDWRPPGEEPGADWRVTDRMAALLRAKPDARMLVLGGYYDLATPILEVRYALDHSAIRRDQIETLALKTGHTPFEGQANLDRLSKRLHRFIRDRTAK